MRQRFFLLLSVAIIAAHWSWSFADWARSPPPIGNAGSIHDVGVFICMLTIVETPVLWGLLRGSGESFRSLGFGTRDIAVAFRSGRVLRGVGSLFVISIVVVPTIRAALARHADGGSTMLTVWGQEPVTSAAITGWMREPGGLASLIVFSVVGGGFREELQRAFCLTRFEHAFGRAGTIGATIVGTVHFGMLHLYQGHWQAFTAGLVGLVLSVMFLRWRRVAETMLVHAGLDVAIVLLTYVTHTSS